MTVELSRTTSADVVERVQQAQVWESWPQPLHVPVCYPRPPSATHPMSYPRDLRSLPARASPAEPPRVEFLACPRHDLRAHLRLPPGGSLSALCAFGFPDDEFHGSCPAPCSPVRAAGQR